MFTSVCQIPSPCIRVFKYTKPHSVLLKKWKRKYDEWNNAELKQYFNNTDQNALADINIYTTNITNHIYSIAKETISNKHVAIRQSDPPGMHDQLRKKTTIWKSKQTNDVQHWNTYKSPAGTWRKYNVTSTSMQRRDVASTLRRRYIYVMCPLGGQEKSNRIKAFG